jgi:hypothetical protein
MSGGSNGGRSSGSSGNPSKQRHTEELALALALALHAPAQLYQRTAHDYREARTQGQDGAAKEQDTNGGDSTVVRVRVAAGRAVVAVVVVVH